MKKLEWYHWVIFGLVALLIVQSIYLFNQLDNQSSKITSTSTTKKQDTLSVAEVKKDTSALELLQLFLDSLKNSEELKNAAWGFCLKSIDGDSVVSSYNENLSIVPASVMKAVTTGVALDLLGANYSFSTRLQYHGEMKKDKKKLNGDIVIKGGGDPTLGSSVFGGCEPEAVINKWVAAIKKLGVDTINGSIIADDRLFEFDIVPAGWAWEDMQGDYCSGACGLSFAENMYNIKACCFGDSMRYSTYPEVPGLKLYNQMAIGTEANTFAFVTGSPYMNHRFIRGNATSGEVSLQVQSQTPDPALMVSYNLLKALRKNGIVVTDTAVAVRSNLKLIRKLNQVKEFKTIHTIYSPSLLSIVNHTNHVSQNFYAETLLKMIAVKVKGHGSTYGGAMVIREYMASKGIDVSGLYQVDGSGVSRYNAITPKQLTSLLAYFAKDSTFNFENYYQSLPIVGVSGTVAKLCKGTKAENNIHAKSGYMSRVRSYAGYVTSKSGKLLSFTMMSNNHGISAIEMRDKWEKLMVLMAELD